MAELPTASHDGNSEARHPRVSLRTAVVGVSGYAGGKLARLLLAHPRLKSASPIFFGRRGEESLHRSTTLEHMHPQLAHGANHSQHEIQPFSWQLVREQEVELVFLALPHEVSREWVPEWLNRGVSVIDLSGAWRLQQASNRAIYKFRDEDVQLAETLQTEAVYGCPELHRARIAHARLVANPGCYATSIILALAPLLRANLIDLACGIVCDAKSGVSGAGKTLSASTHFMHAADNLSAYSVSGHRHAGELLEQLGLTQAEIQFTPHLLPIPRGILSTIYVRLGVRSEPELIEACLREFYATSPLVRVRATPTLPEIQHVVHTSFCDLGFHLAGDGKRLILISCLDNLLKGASGQAIQNMNIMCGWHESEGLL